MTKKDEFKKVDRKRKLESVNVWKVLKQFLL